MRGRDRPGLPAALDANSVAYDDAAELAAALDGLDSAYERGRGRPPGRCGCRSSTRDRSRCSRRPATRSTARRRRCRSSSTRSRRSTPATSTGVPTATPAELGRLNDLAYGLGRRRGDGDGADRAPSRSHALRRPRRRGGGLRARGTMDHGARSRLLLRRHAPRPPRRRPRQPADERRARPRPRARAARPRRCSPRRWASRSTLASASRNTFVSTCTSTGDELIRDEQIEAAVEALSASRAASSEAEAVVEPSAPGLQRILGQALASGGWFAESHEAELRKALAIEDRRGAARRRCGPCSPRRRGWG